MKRLIFLILLFPALLVAQTPYYVPNMKINKLKVSTLTLAGTLTSTGNIIMPDDGYIGFAVGAQIGFDNQATDEVWIVGAELGIGTKNPSSNVHLYAASDAHYMCESTGSNTSAGFKLKDVTHQWNLTLGGGSGLFFTEEGANTPVKILDGCSSNTITATSTGVGIKTLSPDSALHVNGGLKVTSGGVIGGDLAVTGIITGTFGGSGISGEMYVYDNSTATTIETADTPIMLRSFITGDCDGVTFTEGSTGAITAYADAGGGEVTVTSTAHGLSTGDIISIRGTTNYNGVFEITAVDANSFKITDTWVADDGASDWDEGDYFTIVTAGDYMGNWSISVSEHGAAGSIVHWHFYVNTTECTKCTGQRKFSNNDVGNVGSHAKLTLSANDRVSIIAESDGVNTITIKHGNVILEKL